MRNRFLACCYCVALGLLATAPARAVEPEDKRPLEHEDYDSWTSLGASSLSNDGKWAYFTATTGKERPGMTVRHLDSEKQYEIVGVSRARFTFDSQFLVFVVQPDPGLIKQLKEKKTPEALMPKSKVQVLALDSGTLTTVPNASSFSLPDKAAGWVAITLRDNSESDLVKAGKTELGESLEITESGLQRPEKEKQYRERKEAKQNSKEKSAKEGSESGKSGGSTKKSKNGKSKELKKGGATLVLHSLETGLQVRYPNVTSHRFSEEATYLAMSVAGATASKRGVQLVELDDMQVKMLLSGAGDFRQVVFSDDEKQLAFLSNVGDETATEKEGSDEDERALSVYRWSRGSREAKLVAGAESEGLPEGWEVYASTPFFSEDGKRLYFRTRPTPEKEDEKKDDAEVAKLDLWHWQDPFLQPQQLLNARAERNRSYAAVYDTRTKKMCQLATTEVPNVSVDPRSDARLLLGSASSAYDKMRSWDVQSYSDWFLVDQKTGELRKIAERQRGNASLSPGGKFLVWFDGEAKTWYSMGVDSAWESATELKESGFAAEPVDLAEEIPYPVHNELHDQPSLPGSYRSAGWLDDDEGLILYDRWDLWQVDPSGEGTPMCLTLGKGREELKQFRYRRLDSEQPTIDPTSMWLTSLDHKTKATGVYQLTQAAEGDSEAELTKMIELDESLGSVQKARDSDRIMMTRSTFERFPDLWSTTLEFKAMQRLSRLNPQQEDFIWGSAELVQWTATDGRELDGILYKPEDFDPAKKYPLMVYFYERNSDNLHRYYAPAAGRSIINFSFYISRGYVIFVPDIPYTVGEPGPSAANAVLPGVQSIVDLGFIDESKIGMQGHSWGGYQTAYLVTVTDMFACAESGAPVSNMTSAYGGIRWGSGMSRMFQYEKTQSRIGATLWEAREKYIANSPLFTADKINTPLLILHNDEDTAVPWYQGIELFVALRRLEKPAWMLNYNGDPHWVMGEANRIDFAKRMQQFFDHYMKDEPMPVWMADGIPAVVKGKEFGLEYVRPEESSEASTSEEEVDD
ncbi:MAG: prolyl oligopeptidase family serine peptidase [Pirellulaceae bacterium]